MAHAESFVAMVRVHGRPSIASVYTRERERLWCTEYFYKFIEKLLHHEHDFFFFTHVSDLSDITCITLTFRPVAPPGRRVAAEPIEQARLVNILNTEY